MKLKKISEGIHPLINILNIGLFTFLWVYALFDIENTNWLIYAIGMVGSVISIYIAINNNRNVYWETLSDKEELTQTTGKAKQ